MCPLVLAALTVACSALADAVALHPPRTAPSHNVALDYYSAAGRLYKLHLTAATWSGAREICRREGAELAHPTNERDRELLDTIRGNDELWLGVYASWRTLDDELAAETPRLPVFGAYLATDNSVRAAVDPAAELPFVCQLTAATVCNTSVPGYAPGPDGESCYKLHETKMIWSESEAACEAEGAHLAIANSRAEAAHLVSIMAGAPIVFKYGVHSGFRDALSDGNFTTIDGRTLAAAGYALWEDGQPDNDAGAEHCGNMRRNGKLNDIGCQWWKLAFICEREVSTPSHGPSDVQYNVVQVDEDSSQVW